MKNKIKKPLTTHEKNLIKAEALLKGLYKVFPDGKSVPVFIKVIKDGEECYVLNENNLSESEQ